MYLERPGVPLCVYLSVSISTPEQIYIQAFIPYYTAIHFIYTMLAIDIAIRHGLSGEACHEFQPND